MVYTCDKHMTKLEFKSEDGKLIGTVSDNQNSKRVFSEFTKDTFHRQNITVMEDKTWRVNADVYAVTRSNSNSAHDKGKTKS